VHLAALGHPLVGDEFYETQGRFKPFHLRGESMETREVETGLPIRRHALHAARLEFAHPVSGHWMRHTAGLPVDFRDTLALLESQRLEGSPSE
jgi:23S rRNA pseudouridine1911/1915/1917 synthase